jgi:hypothetical protein
MLVEMLPRVAGQTRLIQKHHLRFVTLLLDLEAELVLARVLLMEEQQLLLGRRKVNR